MPVVVTAEDQRGAAAAGFAADFAAGFAAGLAGDADGMINSAAAAIKARMAGVFTRAAIMATWFFLN